MPLETLSNLLPWRVPTVRKHLSILQANGVLKQDKNGYWYSKRMYEDWLTYQKSKEDGARGGNPLLVNPPLKAGVNPPLKAEIEREIDIEEEGEFPPKILELTAILRSLILQRKPDRKLATSWAKNTASAIDRMIRLDGRNLEQVRRVIEWSQDNDFWWKNILSGEKLREKFDQLEADMGTESKPKLQAPVDDLERLLIPLDGKNYTQKQVDDLIAVDQVVRAQGGYRFTTSAERKRALELKEQTRQIASARSV